MIDVRRLGSTRVLDTDGATVRLGSLWSDRPAVLVWLRHFGCLFCKEQTAEFRARANDIQGGGARLAFIGNGVSAMRVDSVTSSAPSAQCSPIPS